MSDSIDNGPYFPGGSARDTVARAPSQGRSGSPARQAGLTSREVRTLIQPERLHAMREAIDNAPDVDTVRIERIRERIARGRYRLDPDRIAARLAALERMLHE